MRGAAAGSARKRTAGRRVWQALVLLVVALTLTSCREWRGIANVSLPGGPGSGPGSYTVYVKVPDTLALSGNSKVLVADVFVGAVDKIELKDWVGVLTLRLNKDVHLPRNATAKIGQTSLLGSQHIALAAPAKPAGVLKNGDTIEVDNSSYYPTIERTLAGLALLSQRGGFSDLETLTTEFNAVVAGRADQFRAFLGKLDTLTRELNEQREDITHAINSSNRLIGYLAEHPNSLEGVLVNFSALFKYFNRDKAIFIDGVDGLGQAGEAVNRWVSPIRPDLVRVLNSMTCPASAFRGSGPYLVDVLKILTIPFPNDSALKVIRGDYMNATTTLDLSYASIDNAVFTGTGLSGALRALEQSFGHDPEMMIPDVRYTPNPASAPGGPYVERADRNC